MLKGECQNWIYFSLLWIKRKLVIKGVIFSVFFMVTMHKTVINSRACPKLSLSKWCNNTKVPDLDKKKQSLFNVYSIHIDFENAVVKTAF